MSRKTQSLKWDEGCPFWALSQFELSLGIGPLLKENLEILKSLKMNFLSHRRTVIFLQEHSIPY